MPRKLLSQPAEVGCSETWQWKTDILPTEQRDEQRLSLREYPNETVSVVFRVDETGEGELNGQDAIIRAMSDLIACKGEVDLPMWHLADTIALAGTEWDTGTRIATIKFSATFTPFEVWPGESVLVQAAGLWRRALALAYDSIVGTCQVDFGVNIGAAITDLRQIVPVRSGLAEKQAKTTFGRWANVSQNELEVRLDRSEGRTGWGTSYDLNLSGSFGWPVIEMRGVQDSLTVQIESGNQLQETPSGFPHYVTRWKEAKLTVDFRNTFNRYQSNIRFWRAFATAIRGSQKPFWFPTRRSDFEVLAMVGVAGIRLRGRQFFDMWSQTNVKALCLDSGTDPICVRYAATCVLDGDDTVIGFEDDLPWATPVRQCSIALPCRLEGDTFKFTHKQRKSELAFSACSVQVEFIQEAGSPVDPDLIAHIDASSIYAKFDYAGKYKSLAVDGEVGGVIVPVASGKGPRVSALNYLRCMGFQAGDFDPTGFGLDAFLWTDTDSLAIDYADPFGIDPVDFDPIPVCRYIAKTSLPWPMIVESGVLGSARWKLTYDGVTAFGISQVTKASCKFEGFELQFAEGNYTVGDYWTVKVSGFRDRLAANHLTYSDSGAPPALDYVDGVPAVSASDSAPFVCAVLTGGREVSGPMTVVICGRAGTTPESRVLFEGGTGQRRIETDSSGGVRIVGGGTSASVGDIEADDRYLIVVIFNGAASQIHLLKNSSEAWDSATVDDGGAATNPLDQAKLGATWHQTRALFAAEGVPDDLEAFLQGFAYAYQFANSHANTAMQAPGESADSWAVLHNNSEAYVLSVAHRIDQISSPIALLYGLRNSTGDAGFEISWLRDSLAIRVEWIGTGGTFTEDFPVDFAGFMVFEVAFASGAAECFLDGDSVGTMTPGVGFTFEAAQDAPFIVGEDSGFSFGELIVRRGAELQFDALDAKWRPDYIFTPAELVPILVFDHAGIGATQWVPSIDVHSMGTPTGVAGTLDTDWHGTGKGAVDYGSGRVERNVTGAYDHQARTWVFVGDLPASPGNGTGFSSSRSAGAKIFPMFWDTSAGGSLGMYFHGGTGTIMFSGLDSFAGMPFVLAISALDSNGVGDQGYRACLMVDGLVLNSHETFGAATARNLIDGISIGGWTVSGGNWNAKIAAMPIYQNPVSLGLPGEIQLQALAQYWADQYPEIDF